MKKIYTFFSALTIGSLFLFATPTFAVEDVFSEVCKPKPGVSTEVQNSTVCKSKDLKGQNPLFGPQGVMTAVIHIVSIIVGIVATIMILIGGFKLITSGSNPQDVGKARETIIYAIVGLIIAALAQVIVQFVLKRIN